MDMERRAFFKTSFSKLLGIFAALVLAYPLFSFLNFRKITKKTVVFHPDEQTSDVFYKDGVFLINRDSRTFALSARCTHLGCTLNYDRVSGHFKCPCHGSEFDGSGRRVAGPAGKELEEVPFERSDKGDILVTLHIS